MSISEEHFNYVYYNFIHILGREKHNCVYCDEYIKLCVLKLRVTSNYESSGWDIRGYTHDCDNPLVVFYGIPTKALAKDILDYFKQTEMLFI